MKKSLIIVGARGFGREVYNTFDRFYGDDGEWIVKGFLDSQNDILNGYSGYPPIIGCPETYEIQREDRFFCAMGDVQWRKHYVDIITKRGGIFTSIIAPNCHIGRNTRCGIGCYIDSDVYISCDINIGDYTYIFGFSVLGHDVKVGNYCHLGAYSFLGGFSKIEDLATLHPGARILPHKIVGERAVVGAGSVVIRNVPANTTVIGVPAKKVEY